MPVHRMAYTQFESRDQSIGDFPISPRMPPQTSASGFRTKWLTLSSSARGLLCFYPDDRAYEDSIVAPNTPAWSDVTWPSPRDNAPPFNEVYSRSHQVHPEIVAKYQGRNSEWVKTTTTTKLSSTENQPSLGAVASANAPLIKDRGARRHGLANPLCNHHAALLYLNARTRADRREVATGDTVEALIDAILQIGDASQGCRSGGPNLGTPLGGSEARSEGATNGDDDDDDDGSKRRRRGPAGAREAGVGKEMERFAAGACWEDVDARRAWEAMKRRVMHVEEYGALPPEDVGEAVAAVDHGVEPALREYRARRRRCWAEEAIRGQVRDEPSRRAAMKKRRRHAGCWIRENDVFVRLVSETFEFFLPQYFFSLRLWTYPVLFTPFTVRTSNVRH